MTDQLRQYQETVQNPPKPGDLLVTIDGEPVILFVQTADKKAPFIFGRVYVNEVFGSSLGWYMRGLSDEKSQGWKCILMTRARREVMQRCNVVDGKIKVKSLRVVRQSASGNSLLCEIGEYCATDRDGKPQDS